MLKWLIIIVLTPVLLVFVMLSLAYAFSKVDPVVWQPGPNPGLTGPFEKNNRLAAASLLLQGIGHGPEDLARGPDGSFYTGMEDGRIVRFTLSGDTSEFVNTGGRPLGMEFAADGTLMVADAVRGLLAITPGGDVRVVADSYNGERLLFVDDLTIAADGTVWFTDVSRRFGYANHLYVFLDGNADGRVFSYSPVTGALTAHLDDLFFANGVALGPDEAYLLVAETGAGQIRRLWLKGDRAGEAEVFIDGLPGAPDNLSFNGEDIFWVALAGLRSPDAEKLADKPLVRRLLGALPATALLPQPEAGFVIGVGTDGRVRYNLQAWGGVYHTTTSAYEWDGTLYIGSVAMDAIATLPAPDREEAR